MTIFGHYISHNMKKQISPNSWNFARLILCIMLYDERIFPHFRALPVIPQPLFCHQPPHSIRRFPESAWHVFPASDKMFVMILVNTSPCGLFTQGAIFRFRD